MLPSISYDPISHILKQEKEKDHIGCIAVCTGGTADISVAEEAAQTAEYFGSHVERIYDVGVSGIHRLLSQEERVRKASCVIAVAGMEGALASVIGGLVRNPVIAVPTSVGYGASFHGLSALLTMINSCANGIVTVNIDNGFGAGYVATQINRLAERGKCKWENHYIWKHPPALRGICLWQPCWTWERTGKRWIKRFLPFLPKGLQWKSEECRKQALTAAIST